MLTPKVDKSQSTLQDFCKCVECLAYRKLQSNDHHTLTNHLEPSTQKQTAFTRAVPRTRSAKALL